MSNPWINNDGLRVKFGVKEATLGRGGRYATPDAGGRAVTEWLVNFSDFVAAGSTDTTPMVVDFDAWLPKGVRIEAVEIVAETAWTSGGSFAFNVGLVRKSDFTTVVDADGLINSLAITAADTAGERTYLTPGVTGAGALIGTDLAHASVLAIYWETAAPTAGVAKIRVYTTIPYTT